MAGLILDSRRRDCPTALEVVEGKAGKVTVQLVPRLPDLTGPFILTRQFCRSWNSDSTTSETLSTCHIDVTALPTETETTSTRAQAFVWTGH